MARLIWAVLCERAVTSKEHNNVSLFETLENLSFGIAADAVEDQLEGRAFCPFKWRLVMTWERDEWDTPETARARLRHRQPSGSSFMQREMELDLTKGPRHRLFYKGEGFPVMESGVHRFELFSFHQRAPNTRGRWRKEGSIPFNLTFDVTDPEEGGGHLA